MGGYKYIQLTLGQALDLYKDVPLWWKRRKWLESNSFSPRSKLPKSALQLEWTTCGPYYLRVKDESEEESV